jgi:hypothetical protein
VVEPSSSELDVSYLTGFPPGATWQDLQRRFGALGLNLYCILLLDSKPILYPAFGPSISNAIVPMLFIAACCSVPQGPEVEPHGPEVVYLTGFPPGTQWQDLQRKFSMKDIGKPTSDTALPTNISNAAVILLCIAVSHSFICAGP